MRYIRLYNKNPRTVKVAAAVVMPRQIAYGFFGVLYSTSFWSGFQTVS